MSIDVNAGETYDGANLYNEDMNVFSDGIANNTLVDKDSILTVYAGGTINTTYVNGGGEVDLAGVASDTQIFTDGYFVVGEDGVASNTTVEGGNFFINSGGLAIDTTINEPGSMTVWADGMTGGSTTVNSGGSLTLEWGWLHQDVAVHGGKMTLKGDTMNAVDGYLMGYAVDSGGSLTVDGCGSAYNGTITDGFATVLNMGKIENVVLDAATVEVKNGAMLSNATMNAGTIVSVEDGANLIDLTVSTGAVLTGVLNNVLGLTFDGGTLDLNIADMYPGDAVRVSGPVFNAISEGTYSCTLTVKDSGQTNGTYSLIEAISSFDKTITVLDTLGSTLGTLTVGESLTVGMSKYTLGLDTAGLFVTVGTGNIITGDVTGETKDVPSGWTALDVNVNTDGILDVYNGGVASKTNVNDSGDLDVYNGGVAYETSVNANGYAYIFNGGSASSATVAADGTFNVQSGGTAEDVKVLSGGFLYAYASATVTDIVADEGARLTLTVGSKTYAAGKYAGTAFEIKETTDGFSVLGNLIVTTGGTAINTTVNKDKWLYVESNGLASNTTVNADGYMFVNSGGSAHIAYVSGGSLTIEDKGSAGLVNAGDLGQVYVSSGGVASNVVVYQYGQVIVSEGGLAGNVTIHKDGAAYIDEGGMVSGAQVEDGGLVNVYGTLADVTVSGGARMNVFDAGRITGKMTFETGAKVYANPGATVDFDLTQTAPGADALVNDLSFIMGAEYFAFTLTVDGTEAGGDYKLAEGATGFDKTITVKDTLGTTLGTLTVAGGKTTIDGKDYTLTLDGSGLLGLTLAGGGITPDLTGDLYATFELTAGMVGSSVNILAGGVLDVMNDGFTSQTTIQSNGDLFVSAGGSADVVTVNFGGDLFVRNGGVATLVMENGGYASVNDGATVTFVPNSFNGYVYDKTDDWATLHSGTTGTDLTVGNAARILVFSSGLAKNTTVNTGGALVVSSGGKADGMNVKDGGTLFVSDGGKATGKMTFETGATVTAETGAILDFDLTQTAPGADALVNDLSFALAQPNFAYTITVDGTEADGDYKLAEGATGFDKTITVVNTLGATLGTLTVAGGKTTIDGRDYTLTLTTGGSLGVTVAGGGITPDLTGDLDYATNLTTGMYASSVNILNGGNLNILNGGLASQTTVNSGGYLTVSAGGSADNVTVNSNGFVYIYSGGSATDIHWTPCEGDVWVYDGGYATFACSYSGVYYGEDGKLLSNTAVMDGKSLDYTRRMLVMNNGTATNTTVTYYGTLDVRSGGTAIDTTVVNGYVHVSSDGMAVNTTVGDNCFLQILSGGVAADATVNAGGTLAVFDGGKVTGKITLETGAVVSAYSKGAILDFDLTATSPGADALVNDLSPFMAASKFVYTLTVSGTEAAGDYKLAEGATGFDKTITVVNTSGSTLGTLTVAGGKTTIDGKDYTLTLTTGGSLGVTVAAGGGTPVDLTGDLTSSYDLLAGKVASSVNILKGGELDVDGGFASQTTVNSKGDLYVSAGGSADVVTVNFGGDLYVSNGATATLVKENGGYASVNDGATVTFVPNSFTGYVYDNHNDWATLHSGTTGTDLSVASAAKILVFSGGIASNTTVKASGTIIVASGGTAGGATVAAAGSAEVSAGGSASGIVAEEGAKVFFYVASGTYAQGTYAGTPFEITSTVTGFEIHSACWLHISDGGTANNTVVKSEGWLAVEKDGKADGANVSSGGRVRVKAGGSAAGIVAEAGAVLSLEVAPNTYVQGTYAGSAFEITDTVTGFAIHSGAMDILAGGKADDVTANPGTMLGVSSGGSATKITENGGYVDVGDGADVDFTPNTFTGVHVSDWDAATVHSGTTATDTAVSDYGELHVFSGGIAKNTTVNADGGLAVYSGGIASDTTVNDKGIVEGNSGGLIDGVVVNSGGSLLIYNGAKLTGQMTFVTGAEVIPFVGSILDFDLTQTAPDAAALVNDLSILMGTPGYTLTVDGTQASGTYNLADGATGFDKTITVMSPLGEEYGTLTVGGSLSTAFADYTLNLSGGALTLDLVAKVVVDTTPPVVSNVAADITAPTNGNVTVTADFTDNVAVAQKLFKFNDEPWQDYPTGGVVVTENATVSFMAIDTSSNNSDVVVITIDNIDKIAPTITAITPSTTEPAASVTVTANFADDVALAFQQFKIGDGAWQDYTTGVTVTENGIIYFRAADAAGNETNASYDVTNIQTLEPDTTKPTVINVAADVTAPTNGSVTVTADFTDNVAVAYKYYKLVPESLWLDYPDAGVVMTENGTVYFEAVDTSGNVSEVVTFSVTNIDKVAPTITGITPSTTAPAASVTVTATFSDDVALASQQYKIGAGAWQNYTTGVLVTENALVTFKAVDTAGNETTATYDVTNISSGGGTVVTGDMTEETKDINTGMVASDVNVNVNGILNILAGGVASNTTVNTEGGLFVSNGGVASQTTVNAGGELFVSAGGSADSNTVIGGVMRVYDGGSASNTTLQDNGAIIIYVGGVASDTIAETDGWIRVSAGGVAEDVTVKNGGKLIIHEGGKVTGKMTFEAGAFVSAENNAIVDFNIYSLSPGNEALVNDLSILQGTPKYTLTINSAQMLGTYNLADGAAGFDQTITVQSILGAEVGTLTLAGGATKIGDVYYTLDLTGSDLTVTVASGGEADTTKPVVTNVMASITTPTNGDVTVTASFYDNVAVASSLYKINSGDWQNYTGGVTVTENATVYFKAIDTSGNESDVVSLTVSNIDKTAPEKPTASANVTAPTNGSVNVTATFAEDSVQNEYSMDGVNWAPYPGLVKFDNNGTVYFRSTDEVGNISEIESYAVTNIDKVPPVKPTASADITTTTSGNVTVTAVFSGDSAKKEFSLDGLVWQDYTAPLVFSANGKAYFRATDAAGNQSDIISYSVTNIQPATPDNAPDDGKNDWVYNKKTKDWNTDENIASFVVNNITAGDSEVRLDKVGSVEKDGKHNFVGRSGSTEDSADYAKIELSKGAALTFSVDSTIAGTFVVLQKTKDKKGNLVTTQRQKISVKAGQTSPKKTTTIYLEAGEYFVGMEAKLPSAKKGDAAAYYNVNLAGTTFFNDADTGWNNTAYKLDGDGKEVKTDLNPELVSNAMLFGRGATSITLDTGAMGKDGYANWVGFSDATDYRMLTLENAANVTLSLTATGKAKLSIWQVSTNAKTGVISLKSKGSVSVKADATGLVKSKFLEAGTYFVSVESTDAKKGGSAYYNVSVDAATVFFDSADTGKNNELYDKKAKAFYPEDKDHHFVTTNISGAGINVQLDSDPVKAEGYKNFVGYQDKIDYAKINLTTDGNLFFKLKATGDATFTVYRKGQDKKGNDTLETIQTTKLKLAKGASVFDKFTDVISGLTAGEYYISMAATNTSTNAKGSVFYNVTATLEPSAAAALAMPESSDSLAMTDSLSFGQFDADVLANVSASSLAELDDKSAWQDLALA